MLNANVIFFIFMLLIVPFPSVQALEPWANTSDLKARNQWKSNIEYFCKENSAKGFMEMSFPFSYSIYDDGRLSKLPYSNAEVEEMFDHAIHEPWQASLVPYEKERLRGLEFIFKELGFDKFTDYQISEILLGTNDNWRTKLSSLDGKYLIQDLDKVPITQPQDIADASKSSVAFALCSQLTSIHVDSCKNSFIDILHFMTPHESMDWAYPISASDLFRDILTDETYARGAAELASKLLYYKKGGTPPLSHNLFDDLENSYQTSGLSHNDAEEKAWNVMGLIATSGTNILYRLKYFKTSTDMNRFKAAISIIVSLANIFDLRRIFSGHLYSLPAQIYTTCDNGKPYHFWMTAYLARKMRQKYHSRVGAMAAAFIAQKVYEMKKRDVGRSPEHAFTSTAFDNFNNVIRMDLAYSSAGAVFGGGIDRQPSLRLNIDEGLKELLGDGANVLLLPSSWGNDIGVVDNKEAIREWSQSSVEAYLRWHWIFAPDSAFFLQLKKLKMWPFL